MFVKVGDQKSINLDNLGVLTVKLDTFPEHCAYAIFYGKKRAKNVLVHYQTAKQCHEALNKIMKFAADGDAVCEIPGEDISMYKSIDITTTFGNKVTFRYASDCMDEFLAQFSIISKRRGHRIDLACYYPYMTGKYANRESATKELESFKEAVKSGLPNYDFILGNTPGVWYADD